MQEMTAAAPALQPRLRVCGDCTLCCKLLPVAELGKPAQLWCRHVVQGKGCGIHAIRPAQCADFICMWLASPALGPEWQPARAKFVLYTQDEGRRLVVLCDAKEPNAWRGVAYYPALKQWAAAAAVEGRQVLVLNGRKVTVLLPASDVELADFSDGDEIFVHRVEGPTGFTLKVEHRKKAETQAAPAVEASMPDSAQAASAPQGTAAAKPPRRLRAKTAPAITAPAKTQG